MKIWYKKPKKYSKNKKYLYDFLVVIEKKLQEEDLFAKGTFWKK